MSDGLSRQHLCVTGLRSTGKSTVARRLAAILRVDAHDTDELTASILARAGISWLEEMRLRRYDRIYRAIETGLRGVFARPGAVTSAGWGCLKASPIRHLLTSRTLLIGLTPSLDPDVAARVLYPRERSRPHFAHLDDDQLYALCRADAAEGNAVLERCCHELVETGDDRPEGVFERALAILRRRALAPSLDGWRRPEVARPAASR